MSSKLHDIPFKDIHGADTSLAAYQGHVLLLVNVASRCGLTPQYVGLQKLFVEKQPQGLTVIGFPANDFGAQEPGSEQEILEFCTASYDVSFPLAQKISVKGPGQHPLYAALTEAQPSAQQEQAGAMEAKLAGYGHTRSNPRDVLWNFEKFLIGRDGAVLARFGPDVAPDSPLLTDAVERALTAA
jgi:glutathione peroxidase